MDCTINREEVGVQYTKCVPVKQHSAAQRLTDEFSHNLKSVHRVDKFYLVDVKSILTTVFIYMYFSPFCLQFRICQMILGSEQNVEVTAS